MELPPPSDTQPPVPNRDDLVRDAQARAADADRAARPWRDVLRGRLTVLLVLGLAWTGAIVARLVHLQVTRHDHYREFVATQQADTEVLPGLRGRILDRHGETLAVTVQRDRVVASPKVIHQVMARHGGPAPAADRLCAAITACTPADRARVLAAITERPSSQYALLWRDVSPADAQRVRALRLAGVYVESEARRFYPNREVAAHVIGHVDDAQRGLTGVEKAYDADVRGRDGQRLVFRDGLSKDFDSIEQPPTFGASLELTIDRQLQAIAEEALAWGVREYNAKGGVAVLADPHTGEILAAASLPTFNPNAFTRATIGNDRNRASQDIYEPGSTFKIVTAAAALETKVMTPETPVDVHGGAIRIGKRVIRDVHAYSGSLPFRQVIAKSSNVGAIRIGRATGAVPLAEYARAFGFGWLTARDLPYPSRGALLKPTDRWSENALASVSMGYQVGVTPLQMVAAASAVANGGLLYEPHVVRAVIAGRQRRPTPVRALHRVVTPETAATLTAIMEEVVETGTAKAARIAGYTIAGKTGTARKAAVGRRGYTDEYNASFVGFVPSRDPVFTALVVIDAPKGKGYYGGAVAAPVFKRMLEAALRHRGVPPNVDATQVARVLVEPRRPPAGVATAGLVAPAPATPVPVRPDVAPGAMPDVRALPAREALRRLTRLGLQVRMTGHGVVAAQDLAPGTPVEPGRLCTLVLARRAPEDPEPGIAQ